VCEEPRGAAQVPLRDRLAAIGPNLLRVAFINPYRKSRAGLNATEAITAMMTGESPQ